MAARRRKNRTPERLDEAPAVEEAAEVEVSEAPGVEEDQEPETVVEEPAPEVTVEEAAPVDSPARYFVAKGKGVGTVRGVIGDEQELVAGDVPRGVERLEELVAAGYAVRR